MRLMFLENATGDTAACHQAPSVFNPKVIADESVTAEIDGRRVFAHGQVTLIEGEEQAVLAWAAGRTLWLTDNPMMGWRRVMVPAAEASERATISREVFIGRTGVEPQRDDLERCNCPEAGKLMHQSCGWNLEVDAPIFMVGPDGQALPAPAGSAHA